MKNDLGWEIMTEFVAIRPKASSYLMNHGNSVKKLKEQKKNTQV